ncbi:hypothetical protein OsJ_02934 [Oryza sativa Japonica Group]|uniref:Uncharacterized protein n=1 Tax=Oryza sativa subsp. japonica TaxID=39947 RepID=B9EYH8_ORYSJ|nr:hypothetical protein OsJ_02934 [Oryza sativa Japonica Group]
MQEERQLPANGDRVLHPGRLPAGARPAGEARRAHRRPGAALVAPLQVQARPGRSSTTPNGSVYGAVLEWDRQAALCDYIPFRPAGAPAAVVALRGTLLRAPTFRRDVTDDLRFLAWDSLKGSGPLRRARSAALRAATGRLGAGSVGKALAKELADYVECHVFNPPSVSLAMSLRGFAETAGELWGRVRSWIPYYGGSSSSSSQAADAGGGGESEEAKAMCRWLPHLYINTNDYICCYYNDAAAGTATVAAGGGGGGSASGKAVAAAAAVRGTGGGGARVARMLVASKGPTKFLEAHGLEQWWADDVELQVALNHSKLIDRQLRSLYAAPPAAAS